MTADSRSSMSDAAIYLGSGAVAAGVALWAGIPIFREWGRLAVGPYAACGVAALLLVRTGRTSRAGRAAVAATVLAGVVLMPLALEVTWRQRTDPGLHAQSEAIVTEEAATALVGGRDPYRTVYLTGPLAARPLETRTHFPYLPAMLAFGLPRAVLGRQAWTDARVWFLAGALVAAATALARRRSGPAGARLSVLLCLVVLPTGALPAVTGGDDLPVVALLLLAAVLVGERRPVGAGIAAGLSVALKQTALVAVPFLVLAAGGFRDPEGRRPAARMAVAAILVAGAFIVPFVAWNPSAFFEDTVRFPLGLGEGEAANAAPSLGRAVVSAFPSARGALTAVLVAFGLAVWTWLLLWRPATDAAHAARRAGVAFVVILLLVPAARIGYVIYPINFLAWGWLLGGHRQRMEAEPVGGAGRPPGRAVQFAGERC